MPDTYDRHGPRDRHLRVGDAEREAVSGILRAQYVAGRLDNAEFEQRLERCLAAKTYADLDALLTDFPGLEAPARRRRRPVIWRFWPVPLLPFALIAAIILSGGHALFLVIPLVFLCVVRPLLSGPSRRLGLRAGAALGRPPRDGGREAAEKASSVDPSAAPCSGFSSVTVRVATRGSATSVSSAASAEASGTPTFRPVFCDSGASVKSMTSTSKWTAIRAQSGGSAASASSAAWPGFAISAAADVVAICRPAICSRSQAVACDSSKPSSDSRAGCSGSAGASPAPCRRARAGGRRPSSRARRRGARGRVHVAVHVEVQQPVAGCRRERAHGAEADRAVAAEHQRGLAGVQRSGDRLGHGVDGSGRGGDVLRAR